MLKIEIIRGNNMDKFLKVKDIAEILDCSMNKAYNVVGQKDFPKIKIGRNYYIPQDEFEKWTKNYLRKEYKVV